MNMTSKFLIKDDVLYLKHLHLLLSVHAMKTVECRGEFVHQNQVMQYSDAQ